ncbi:gluconate 2-dehydrogenase subunit 3 family protein [Paracoccus sp. S1E-3]|uniref:gluconate 2-dehydrogenase subunit 3 family protein n=1 Tax=Paracoccus sp. S1E-3 TaxID=2756130 RepID=UPI0015EE60BC|nr:gluconate 2-dehydrogenase subunit 3 family protein [Paracoccus sp. S1E-3]MBA4489213.1 gluconate 2-dehydrogenase subunit 3 family protein [Paracoccus sp. S1E-3]
MNRRELLSMIAAFTGAALVGSGRAFAYDPTTTGANIFTPEDAAFLDEVAEVIIPKTDTPGAKDAQVGTFMTVYVSDCFTADEQADFRAGIEALKSEAQAGYGKPFTDLTPEERQEFLQAASLVAADQAKVVEAALEKQKQDIAQQTNDAMAADEALAAIAKDLPKLHWFTPIQQLTLFGFFTSQIGATEVLRYEAVPGEYIGDLDYKGEPAWAT